MATIQETSSYISNREALYESTQGESQSQGGLEGAG
jgi:hypothetical protein